MRPPADVLAEEISALQIHLDQVGIELKELLVHAADAGLVADELAGRMCESAAQRLKSLHEVVTALHNLNSQEIP